MRFAAVVVVALAAAAVFGLSSVLEQRTTHEVPRRPPLSPRLAVDLVKHRVFVAALGINLVGSGLQILALHLGSLSVVQPLLVFNLVFAVVIAGATRRPRARPDWVIIAGVACCAGGIGAFLAVAHPVRGATAVSAAPALPLGVGLVAVVAICVAAARASPEGLRPLWLALACGVDFGVNAFLLKVVPATLPSGFADPLHQWPLYLLVVVTPLGFLLNQSAFQAGTLIAPVLAIITVTDPLVSIGIGVAFLHERIATTAPALAGEMIALAAMAAGIMALAQRSPQVARQLRGVAEGA
jgi:drug/metabolite transporter (DMT)-like permease